eukprot:4562264-Pyramimonas_sp.AAC.1
MREPCQTNLGDLPRLSVHNARWWILNKRRIWDKLFFKGGAKLAKHKRASFYEDEHGEAIQAIVDVETTPAVSWRDLSVTTKLGEKL